MLPAWNAHSQQTAFNCIHDFEDIFGYRSNFARASIELLASDDYFGCHAAIGRHVGKHN
jgi:hypothetical protein